MTPPLGILDPLLSDLIDARGEIKKALSFSPDELPIHRIHVMYVDRILDVIKARQQSKRVDRNQLLLESLQTVVRFLLDRGETDCAQVLGDHLEEIEQEVRQTWDLSDNQQTLSGDFRQSATQSPVPSPPSPKAKGKTLSKEDPGR